ncbi:MAG: HIT family protein [Desulfuromonadaceae bacterium]|nr:HIT family protein [Desulfuromonas sp.]MDY0213328.1 HIT family protein [Desulfuromonadaceae bacterium]
MNKDRSPYMPASGFSLDSRLAADCHKLWSSPESDILLMDKRMFRPWFILVPHSHVHELIDLEPEQLKTIMRQIAGITRFLRTEYQPDKINTATIGNMVSQLHVHIVARYHEDPCWPGTVWGWTSNEQSQCKQQYTAAEVETIRQKLLDAPGLLS